MPHPKNRLKLTGDTHPPEAGDLGHLGELIDLGEPADEVELAVVEIAPARVYADGWVPPSQPTLAAEVALLPQPVLQVERRMQRQFAARPWLMVAAALGFGFLVAKMLRR